MKLLFNQRLLSQDPIPPADARALLDTAQALKRAALAGLDQPLLRGKNIALLCDEGTCAAAEEFRDAATRLGARVSRVQPDPSLLEGADGGASKTARVLGKLYDAVECDELPPKLAARLQHEVGVPVYSGLARNDHPLAKLLDGMRAGVKEAAPEAEDRRYLIQAVLLSTIS